MTNPPRSPIDWGDTPDPHSFTKRRPRGPIGWTVLRVALGVFGLLSLAFWGYISWTYPMPAIVFAVGAPLFAIALWYFFRSDHSPIETDIVGKVIVEVALIIAVGGTWVSIGHPLVGLIFVIIAAVSGIITFRRENSHE